MNRKLTTVAAIAAALLSLSACNLVEVANQVIPADTPTEVNYSDPANGVEGAPLSELAAAPVGTCEGAGCPPVAPVTYPPCVTEGANNRCSGEGANG